MHQGINTKTTGLIYHAKIKEYSLFDKRANTTMKWTWFLSFKCKETFINTRSDLANYSMIASKYKILQSDFKTILCKWHMLRFLCLSYNSISYPLCKRTQEMHSIVIPKPEFNPISKDHYLFEQNRMQFYESWMQQLQNKTINTIVIHIRAGDILYHESRYLLNMKYYSTDWI